MDLDIHERKHREKTTFNLESVSLSRVPLSVVYFKGSLLTSKLLVVVLDEVRSCLSLFELESISVWPLFGNKIIAFRQRKVCGVYWQFFCKEG